jgi:glycosyltransferase involved in cell wall biosynthesis
MKYKYNSNLSIVIANYNNSKYLNCCLDSIITSDYPNLELVIVDDGSIDNSKLIIEARRIDLEKRCKGNLQIVYLDSNIGSGRAKAHALELVTGNYCCFVDSDDYVHGSGFSLCMDKFKNDSKLSLVYTNAVKIDASNKLLGLLNYAKDGIDMLNDKVGFHLAIWSMNHYRELTDKFNARLQIAYDIDLYMKLEEVGTTAFIDEPFYYYRVHDRNISIGFDKWGNAYTERIISRWEAQKRRNIDNVKLLGDELQLLFEKVNSQKINKSVIMKYFLNRIKVQVNKFFENYLF